MKLSLPEFQVTREKAEKYVINLCKNLKIPINTKKDLKSVLTIENDKKTLKIDLEKEVEFVIRNGKASMLQHMSDSSDRFLNTSISVGVFGGPGIKISSSYGDHRIEIDSPGLIEIPEVSFSDDIVFYRMASVKAFNENDFSAFFRYYRGYLLCCVSLVECFLHRYTFHLKNIVPSTKDYFNTKILDSRSPIEDRMEAWCITFAAHKSEEFKASRQRSKFIELKNQRNYIIHSSAPTVGYEVKKAVQYLNYVTDAVGGLLSNLRKYSGYTENIGFIRQVATQQEIKILKGSQGKKQ